MGNSLADFGWDHDELILQIWGQYRLTGVATNGTLAESYGYDPLGRRAWTSDGSATTWHLYDGMHCIADVDNSGTNRTYTWGPGIDNLLAITDHSASETNTYYAITDHLGTVHALASDSGSIVESYRYDAWGNILGVFDGSGFPLTSVLGHPTSGLGNRFLFHGREYSWATGLYNFRARWYDPTTGRWLSKDPIGISGGLNQYVAFNNNPVNFRDPLGLLSAEDWTKEAGNEYITPGPSSDYQIVMDEVKDIAENDAKPTGNRIVRLWQWAIDQLTPDKKKRKKESPCWVEEAYEKNAQRRAAEAARKAARDAAAQRAAEKLWPNEDR